MASASSARLGSRLITLAKDDRISAMAASKNAIEFSVFDYAEHSLGAGSDARAICYMEIAHPGGRLFGAAINKNIVTASLEAIVSAVNRIVAG